MSGGCGNVVNPSGFSIISMAGTRGEKGEVTFSLRPTSGRPLFGSPFSPFPAAAVFFLLLFLLEVVLHDRELQRML